MRIALYTSMRLDEICNLRNEDSHIRELRIEYLLGHEATHKSQGATQYTSAIYLQNLQRIVEAITYPDDIGKLVNTKQACPSFMIQNKVRRCLFSPPKALSSRDHWSHTTLLTLSAKRCDIALSGNPFL